MSTLVHKTCICSLVITVAEFVAPLIAQEAWVPRSPPHSRLHAMDTDTTRGRIVLFGGSVGGIPNNNTWEWDGLRWEQRFPSNSPPARDGHAMAFDAVRGKTVVFGGRGGPGVGVLNDTWEWDGSNWNQVMTAVSPGPRDLPAMTFDGSNREIVLHGGRNDRASIMNDTWTYDGTNWVKRTPASRPDPGNGSKMVYDVANGRVVAFGVWGNTVNAPGKTWVWDGNDWARLLTTGAPFMTSAHAMAYDPNPGRDVIVLHAGSDSNPASSCGIISSSTWELKNSTWTNVTSPVLALTPSCRRQHAAAPDPLPGQGIMVFGGFNLFVGHLSDSWHWDGTAWTPTIPHVRADHAQAFDSTRGVTVLFGDTPDIEFIGPADTWTRNGLTWTPHPAAGGPRNRVDSAMADDPHRSQVVLFGGMSTLGGNTADTWVWNGTVWQQRFPGTSPTARRDHAMVYDVGRDRVLLFGGQDMGVGKGDTWEWDGTNWVQRVPAHSPSPRAGAGMVYDLARDRVVLFGGGFPGNNDTWEWDGNDWTQVASSGPPARRNHGMAYDADRLLTVLFGGDAAAGGLLDDTWTWDGSSWRKQSSQRKPVARAGAPMSYDPVRNRTVSFGGRGAAGFLGDTWEISLCIDAGPSLPFAGIPITCETEPVIGQRLLLSFPNTPAPQPAFLLWSLAACVPSQLSIPEVCGTPDFTFYLDPLAVFSTWPLVPIAPTEDPARFGFDTPPLPSLVGQHLCFQGATNQGVCLLATNGLDVVIMAK